jgi:hypothetical protein
MFLRGIVETVGTHEKEQKGGRRIPLPPSLFGLGCIPEGVTGGLFLTTEFL